MRMLHRCDGKVYGPKDAREHPHSKNPAECLKGWREATPREQWEAENYEDGNGVTAEQRSMKYEHFDNPGLKPFPNCTCGSTIPCQLHISIK